MGRSFDLRQANLSVSSRGVARGIHYSDVPPGQGKYVTAVSGSVVDYVIDLRVGSSTFGEWDSVDLDDSSRKAVFLAEGVGHLFIATSDRAVVSYVTTDVYRPDSDRTVSLRDEGLALDLPMPLGELIVSTKDEEAPTIAEALEMGLLPSWADCLEVYERHQRIGEAG